LRRLHKQYSKSKEAEILIVYQKEPHPGQMAFKAIAQPETFEARVELAKKMKDEYEMPMTVLVDTMEDQSRALFSDLPSPRRNPKQIPLAGIRSNRQGGQ